MTLRLLPASPAGAPPAKVAERPSALTDEVLVASARNLTYELPLGHGPLPLSERRRGGWASALRRLERSLVSVAVRHEVPVDVNEPAEALARRLARSHTIAAAAGDAVAALAPVLRRGANGDAPAALEVAAVRVAERLTGYVRSRAG